MPTPTEHAVCSASTSDRWLHCTASPRFEEQFPDKPSEYGEEGRLAHSFAELFGRKKFTPMPSSQYEQTLLELKGQPLYQDEMLRTSELYVGYLTEKAMSFSAKPYVAFEVRVDFSDYVPEGFGTCDCCMIGGNTLRITDYKHGKGVAVSSIGNSQMRYYALGALKFYETIFGGTITDVYTAIVQPRITEDVTEEHLTVDELKAWGEANKPKAQMAFTGIGATFEPGTWCRFCRGNAVCKARAQKNSAFEDFKNCILTKNPIEPNTVSNVPRLSDAEIGDLLARASDLVKWYNGLQDYAQQAILAGGVIPGWKVVAGKSNRTFSDEQKVMSVLTRKARIKTADIFKPREMKSLATIEKMLGKKLFDELLGGLVVKPMGKPTLVPESDGREAYSSTAVDFASIAEASNG